MQSSLSPAATPRFQAVHVIAAEAFPRDNRVWRHIDVDKQHVDFDKVLMERTFSTTERLLLDVAASLWSTEGHPVNLGTVATRLGDGWMVIVLRALAAARGGTL